MNTWSDPIHVEDLFLADDLGLTEEVAHCTTHADYDAVFQRYLALLNRVLGRE